VEWADTCNTSAIYFSLQHTILIQPFSPLPLSKDAGNENSHLAAFNLSF